MDDVNIRTEGASAILGMSMLVVVVILRVAK